MISNVAPLVFLTGTEAFGLFGRPISGRLPQSVSRGTWGDLMREVAEEVNPNLLRMEGTFETGRCNNREVNQCCAGSDWNCQAPGSTCSCDQMCRDFGDCCADYDDTCIFQEKRLAACNLRESPQNLQFGEFQPAQIPSDNRLARGSGDPHYHTFDGKTIHFQGGCVYRLTGICEHAKNARVEGHALSDFVVYAKNLQRFKETANVNRPMAWIQTVIVEMPIKDMADNNAGRKFIIIDQENKVRIANLYVDGYTSKEEIDADRLPYVITDFAGARVGIIFRRGQFIRVQVGTDGLTVAFNGRQNVRINLPCQYNGNVCGMFGNADNDPANDNLMADGTPAADSNQLGMSWVETKLPKITGINADECTDDQSNTLAPEDMCRAETLREAATKCKVLLDPSGPFSPCHPDLPPADYFEDCVYDLCLFLENNIDHNEAMCEIYAEYAEECRNAGVTGINWREHNLLKDTCTVTCGLNEEYYNELAYEEGCIESSAVAQGDAIEGCFCGAGYVRDDSVNSNTFGQCISPSACRGPQHNAIMFNPPQGQVKLDDGAVWNDQISLIDFNDLMPSDCLVDSVKVIDPVAKGGAVHHAPSNWIKPNACCADKAYNTGIEGCCGGRHLYDLNDESCVAGRVVTRL